MRRSTNKTNYQATRTVHIVLLLMFSLRNFFADGQISHHPDYEIPNGRRSAVPGGGGVVNTDSNEDESLTGQPNGMQTNGEIIGPKSFPLGGQDPSCEELRAMWIFSKRQSRAAEMSNEIPTYRDPFLYNVWEPIYANGRGIGSRANSNYRDSNRPVFGRVISREPVVLQRFPSRSRVFEDVPTRLYGSETRSAMPSLTIGPNSRRYMQYRFSGSSPYGSTQGNVNNPNVVHQGSFQKLKELIWTERAKELTQQRKAEELAARAAVLKEISAGQMINRHTEQNDEPMSDEQNLSPDQQLHSYHHNTDGRVSIGNVKQPGAMKSIFSGNPSNANSARSGRPLVPGIIGGEARERGNLQRNFPIRPSHFRERNRVLFRQATPSDYYQRESRSGSLKFDPTEEQTEISSKPIDDEDTPDDEDKQYQTNNNHYSFLEFQRANNERQQQLEQLNRMFQKLYQFNKLAMFAEYPSLAIVSRTKHDYDENNIDSENESDTTIRDRRRGIFSNNDILKHSLNIESY